VKRRLRRPGIIKKLKNCKLIISGDFHQLNVINDLQKYYYKDASNFNETRKFINVKYMKIAYKKNEKDFILEFQKSSIWWK
jgi:hypothetical protein